MFITKSGTFVYNEYTCIDALKEEEFDVDEVRNYLSDRESLIEKLKIAKEEYEESEHWVDSLNATVSEMYDFLLEVEDMLRKGKPTKEKIAERIDFVLRNVEW